MRVRNAEVEGMVGIGLADPHPQERVFLEYFQVRAHNFDSTGRIQAGDPGAECVPCPTVQSWKQNQVKQRNQDAG